MISLKSVIYDLEDIFSLTGSYDPFEIAHHLDIEIVYTTKLPIGYHGLAVLNLTQYLLLHF